MDAVWIALIRLLETSASRTIYIVIDGLDECDIESLDAFLGLASIYFKSTTDSLYNVKWIFTSRNDVEFASTYLRRGKRTWKQIQSKLRKL